MKNMTITVEEDVLRWAKVWAAQHDTSVSRLVGEMLRERMQQDHSYAQAMEAYLASPPRRLSEDGRYPAREALYDRHDG
jgi:cytochrome c-type biogenesis protein CcmH/NrfG